MKQKDLRSHCGGLFVSEEKLEIVPNVISGASSNDTATAENNDNNGNDQSGIVFLGFFNDGRHLIVHDFFSSCGMMDDVAIISGSLSVGAPIQPVHDECGDDDQQGTDQHRQ